MEIGATGQRNCCVALDPNLRISLIGQMPAVSKTFQWHINLLSPGRWLNRFRCATGWYSSFSRTTPRRAAKAITMATLTTETSFSERSTQAAIKNLVGCGLISVTPGGRRSRANIYHLEIPQNVRGLPDRETPQSTTVTPQNSAMTARHLSSPLPLPPLPLSLPPHPPLLSPSPPSPSPHQSRHAPQGKCRGAGKLPPCCHDAQLPLG